MGINVISQSSKERREEIKKLFEEMKPYLDDGKTYNQAVSIVKNTKTTYSHTQWFKDLVEYGESQGYLKDNYDNWYKYGLLNVTLMKNCYSLTGYYWVYTHRCIDGRRKTLSSNDLCVLKKRVEEKGYLWKVLNQYKVEKAIELNRKLQSNKRPSKSNKGRKSTSGVRYVTKLKNYKSKRNFYWGYKTDGVFMQSTTLKGLKDRVVGEGYDWNVIDDDVYHKNLIEDESL